MGKGDSREVEKEGQSQWGVMKIDLWKRGGKDEKWVDDVGR